MNSQAPNRILLVDDEPDILEFLSYTLKKKGYEISCCERAVEAIDRALQFRPNIILLDIMMPGVDGVEICTRIRQQAALKNVIIAFLTARGEDYSQIAGFEAGADDYIVKPIKPDLLLARIEALLRRTSQKHLVESAETKALIIDRDKFMVTFQGNTIELRKMEFELLDFLYRQNGKVVTRQAILNQVWGRDLFVTVRTVDVHINKLREKISPQLVKTVKGVGYSLDMTVASGSAMAV